MFVLFSLCYVGETCICRSYANKILESWILNLYFKHRHRSANIFWSHPIAYKALLYPPKRSLGGVYWIHPVRPSVCLSVCLSVRPSVRPWVGVRMITLILFSGFKNFFYIYHLGQDLAWDWISASYLIKYAHTGRSCDLLIFGIPEVNFSFLLGMLLRGVFSERAF